MATEGVEADDDAIYMFETYKDEAGAKKHPTEPQFQEFFKTVTEEGLAAKAPVIKTTRSFAGFDKDRELKTV